MKHNFTNSKRAKEIVAMFFQLVKEGETKCEIEFAGKHKWRILLSDNSIRYFNNEEADTFNIKVSIPVNLNNVFGTCPVCYAEDIFLEAVRVLEGFDNGRQAA